MRAEQILFTQGFGTRYECRGIVELGRFRVNGSVCTDPDAEIPTENLTFSVDGVLWPFYEKAIVMMNKPEHYECSLKPLHHPSVSSLLPPQLRCRSLQPVGRLDEDTTGLILFTDDGQLLHKLTHPKKKIVKVYRVTLKHPVTQKQIDTLLAGVILNGEKQLTKASQCNMVSDHVLELTISSGKYHQVKRMIAAVSNRVIKLERIKFGGLVLPEGLAPGKWTWIPSEQEIFK